MSDEDLENKDDKQQAAAKPNAAEDKARQGGWVPLKEWQGPEEDWIDAREFNVRGEMISRIQDQSGALATSKREIGELKDTVKHLADMNDKIAEREYKKALRDLNQQKAEAVDEGDGEKVVALDEEIDSLKEHKKSFESTSSASATTTAPDNPPEVNEWLSKQENQWYNTDETLRAMANGIVLNIKNNNPALGPTEVLAEMTRKMHEEMPHRFKVRKTMVNDGGGDRNNSGSRNKKTVSFSDMNEDQKSICKRLERMGVMTREKYIEDLVAIGEL